MWHDGKMRVFAGIDLPQEVRDHLAGALAMVAPPGGGRNPWIPAMNWHITLGFFGEQPEAMVEELGRNLPGEIGRTRPFEISLAGAGVFRHNVCWVGVSDPCGQLGPLAEKVRQGYATDGQNTQNRFHVTISRAGRQADLKDLIAALSVYRSPVWTVQEVIIFRSNLGEGPAGHSLYTPLLRIPLGM